MTIYADNIEYQGQMNTVVAKGFVDIRYKDLRVLADYVRLNTVTGEGLAYGNVEIKDQNNRIFCEKARFNIFEKRGTIYNSKGFVNGLYYITARQLEWLGENKYRVREGTMSSCQGKNPLWSFHIVEAEVEPDSYAFLKRPSFRIKNIPLFYSPLFYVPMSRNKRKSGFLTPKIGFGNKDGFTMGNSFFWAIKGNTDSTFGLDTLGERGFRPRLEYRYVWNKDTSGRFNGSFLHDRKTGGNYYKIEFEHKQRFRDDIFGRLKLDLLSENNGDREFAWDIKTRTRRYSDSFFELTKQWENSSLKIYSEYLEELREDNSPFARSPNQVFAKLPEIVYTYHQQRLLNTPFFFQFQTSLVDFYRKEGPQKEQQLRLDLFPQISLPLTKYPWFSLTPSFGLRETYYNPVEGDHKGDLLRQYPIFQMDFQGPKTYRIYKVKWDQISALKHLIEPRITYSYSPEWTKERERRRILIFDSLDSLRPRNYIHFSLINRLLAKEKDTTREVVRFELTQGYDFWKASHGKRYPMTAISYDLDTHIFPFLEVNLDGTYNLYKHEFTRNSQQIRLRHQRWGFLNFERRYVKERAWDRGSSEFYNITLGIDFLKNWALQFSTRYDAAAGIFLEKNYSIGYQGSCFTISLNFIDRTTEDRFYRRDNEFEFGFLVNFYGLGSLGKKLGGKPVFSLHR